MADLITLTAQPARVTGTGTGNIWSARDVSNYNFLDLEVTVVAWESPSSPSIDVGVISGFQLDPYGTWPEVAVVTLTQSAPFARLLVDEFFGPYLTWTIAGFSGATAATIWIRGMARMRQE